MSRLTITFGALVFAQTAHSVEEYCGHLWKSFPPARFVTRLVSTNLEQGFLIINISIFAFGLWCLFWPIRQRWSIAAPLAWLWVVVEILNGAGHPLWSIRVGSYTPGVATAPVLLVVAVYLTYQLLKQQRGQVSDTA